MTDTSPAAELQAAADKIRALVAAATRGPWTAVPMMYHGAESGYWEVHAPDSEGVVSHQTHEGGGASGPDAAYIAALHPSVGAALAEWLERAGEHVRLQALCCDNGEHQCSEIAAPALAVARQINGGPR